jgi:hypothetical protein
MQEFIAKHKEEIAGVLSGFDRLVFRGTLRSISYAEGMTGYLWAKQVRLTEFGKHVLRVSERLKQACNSATHDGRTKESLAQFLARGDTKASHWSKEGADIVYRSGKIQLLVERKSFRQTVAKNLAAFRWGRRAYRLLTRSFGGRTRFSCHSNSSTACRVALSKGCSRTRDRGRFSQPQ